MFFPFSRSLNGEKVLEIALEEANKICGSILKPIAKWLLTKGSRSDFAIGEIAFSG